MPVDPLRILFVINPTAGKGPKAGLEQDIRDYFQDAPHRTDYYQLCGTDDAAAIRRRIAEWKPVRVVAVGGDGTLRSVAAIVAGMPVCLGLLPAGSANGMAKELGIPDNLQRCMEIVTGDYKEQIDLIRINNRDVCLHLSDFGLNAHLVKHFEESDSRGMWGYVREIFKVMRSRQQFRVEIKTPEKTIFRYAWMVVIANARMYGTGAMINPAGNLRDGLLEVIVMRQISFGEIIKMMLRRRSFDPHKTEVIQAREVHIRTRRSVHFQIDGEYTGRHRKISAKVEQQAITMLLPEPE